jgi:hypothetical protein
MNLLLQPTPKGRFRFSNEGTLNLLLSWLVLQIQARLAIMTSAGPGTFVSPFHKKNRFGIINKEDL